jgi:glutathione synthase/RimK-type ligase-like ATP-grasp enzyme
MPQTQKDVLTASLKYIIVTDRAKLFAPKEGRLILTPQDYINQKYPRVSSSKRPKIINLSSDYSYLSKGYYVSLLAEARGEQCVPNVENILELGRKRHYESGLPELNTLLEKHFREPFEEPLSRTYTSFFGRHPHTGIEPISRRLFDLYRFPIVSFEVKYTQPGKWIIDKIETPSINSLVDRQMEQFHDGLERFTGAAWRMKTSKKERYWIAILHNPEEAQPPSNKAALSRFIAQGKKLGLWVELITRQDFATVLEYDALFIRETTAINSHTYRFALKAEQENIPCIDDTTSIIRCCNKVYLKELMEKHRILIPKSLVLDKKNLTELSHELTFPMVLKVPDGAFSKGVVKVSSMEELKQKSADMFQKSDIVLLQEFMASEFDWRIGVINNEPLYAVKYYMAQDHWQIYNYNAKKDKHKYGNHECVPIENVPASVLKAALSASSKIGNGLYGVDLKQLTDGRVVVIEVNDNPNIDHGIEDQILGDQMYTKILQHLVRLIEA